MFVLRYINTLADALRSSGTRKPVYYNSWHGRTAAAGRARIDGVTGSNYPTGLVAGHALKGSQIVRARGSSLNPDDTIKTKSRMVYEFDAADVPGSYMYPSMTRFFRSEGFQVAAHFQYDPVSLADVNRNWKTHQPADRSLAFKGEALTAAGYRPAECRLGTAGTCQALDCGRGRDSLEHL